MNRKKRIISFLIYVLLICTHIAGAQIHFDSSYHVAELEQKGFEKLLGQKQMEGAAGLTRTAASGNFDVNFYRCEWEIDPNARYIKGKVTSYFTTTAGTDNITFDLSDTLQVDSITFHGIAINFQRIANDGLQLQFPAVLNNGQQDSVSIFYQGVPRSAANALSFYTSSHAGEPVMWTLSEPYGAKEWWPCKNGLNDKADSLDVIITSPVAYSAATNGLLVKEEISGLNKTAYFRHRYPIASYLVGIAVTNYVRDIDSVQIGNTIMPVVMNAYPEYEADFKNATFYAKQYLQRFSNLFGTYPFIKEQYSQTQFNANGGMEHQTNSFIGSPRDQLVVHELGHQWFGDKITCSSWHDTWLNEGFATYCEVLYLEDGDSSYFYLTLHALTNVITAIPNGSVWVDDTTSSGRIFSQRLTYYKGSYLLHMLRGIMGDSAFFSGIRRYLNDPTLKYRFATTADLQRNLELESRKNLSSFFHNWFNNQGYPIYSFEWMQDSSNLVYAKINQTTSDPSVSFFDMPVPVEFKNSTRDTIIVLENTKNGQAFLLDPGFKADTVLLDPYYWVLCHKSVQHVPCGSPLAQDSILPFYNIKWSQNSNNWIYIDVRQAINTQSALAKNIPFYIHFTGSGKDTSIQVSFANSQYSGWINAGFRVTAADVTTSCLMNNNYIITNANTTLSSNEIKIYPVPLSGNRLYVSLKNPTDKHLHISLYNTAGQLLYRETFDTPGKDELFSLPVSLSSAGMYIIRLESESSIRVSKKLVN